MNAIYIVRCCLTKEISFIAEDYAEDRRRYKEEALAEANRLRKLHSGTPGSSLHLHDIFQKGKAHPLRLDPVLSKVAQRYADLLAESKKPRHSNPRSRLGQGENIAVECSHKSKIIVY